MTISSYSESISRLLHLAILWGQFRLVYSLAKQPSGLNTSFSKLHGFAIWVKVIPLGDLFFICFLLLLFLIGDYFVVWRSVTHLCVS